MLIFLEGPDGSGKSSLAKQLSEQTGYPVKSFSYPKSQEEKDDMYYMYVNFIVNNSDTNLIVDRCWYSEMVYGPLMRNEVNITTQQMYELESLVADNGGGMVIHLTAPVRTLFERVSARGDDYIEVSENFLKKVKHSYDILMHEVNHKIPVVRYEHVDNLPWL